MIKKLDAFDYEAKSFSWVKLEEKINEIIEELNDQSKNTKRTNKEK